MFNVVLYQPEIPPNTGNIMRLCANSGFHLHLIKPLGFSLSDKHLKRANLDYILPSSIQIYENFIDYLHTNSSNSLYFCSTKADISYAEHSYQKNDHFIFGPETRGLPQAMLDQYPTSQKIRIPMKANSRSLNLSNAVAIILYEAWRQHGFSAD
jgi:tRNA (cytidine/uridine-2'-O-)-methyltransferase